MNESVQLVKASDIEIETPVRCHFCNATPKKCIPAHGSKFHEKKGMQVECINCGSRGPIFGDKDSAFKGWKNGDCFKIEVK